MTQQAMLTSAPPGGQILPLRDYQQAAIDAIVEAQGRGVQHQLLSLATGAGKTVIAAHLARLLGRRTVFMVHRDELAHQSMRALAQINPGQSIGLCKADRDDLGADLIVVSAQTIARQPRLDRLTSAVAGSPLLFISDEAHHDRAESRMRAISALTPREDPSRLLVGLTATPTRGDRLGLDEVYDEIVYHLPMLDLMGRNYLARLKGIRIETDVDLDSVHTRYGEFVERELDAAVDTPERNTLIVEAWKQHARDAEGGTRKRTLAFCASVAHARHLVETFRDAGIEADAVFGETPFDERQRIFARFRDGLLPVLCNVMVATEGYDEPAIDCIVMARPTQSPGLYIQMAGRGARKSPEKADCIAEGQRVLTDRGLVPIERVTTEMRVWDGVEFVEHAGVVCKGEQEVITYAGLTATPDHRVLTPQGWKALWECRAEQTSIVRTGVGGRPVREARGHLRRGSPRRWWALSEAAPARLVHRLRDAILEGLHQFEARDCRLSSVWTAAPGSEVALSASAGGAGAMHKADESPLLRLRRAGCRVPVRVPACDGSVGAGQPRPGVRPADRPHRQRWALRAGEPALGDGIREPAEPPRKARVYDILNAGPRHRFTAEGLLVHNCLILDFSDNTSRHSLVMFPTLAGAELTESVEEQVKAGEPVDLMAGAQQALAIKEQRAIEVDLFGQSPVVWQRPAGGMVFFAPAGAEDGNSWVAVTRQGDGYVPVMVQQPRERNARPSMWPLFDRPVDVETAQSLAEEAVKVSALTSRQAPWRQRNDPPSPAQMSFARRLGIPTRVSEGMTKAQLSAAIDERLFMRTARDLGLEVGTGK